MKLRGFNAHVNENDFYNSIETDLAKVTFYPAGHILGSAMTFVESDFGNLLYTGDYRSPASLASEGFHLPDKQVDLFVTEATFSLPIYRWKSHQEIKIELCSFALDTLNDGFTPIFLAYNLGKAQEIMFLLKEMNHSVQIHEAGYNLSKVYSEEGFSLGNYEAYQGENCEGKILICPSSALSKGFASHIKKKRITIGSRTISTAAADYCNIDYEVVFKPCRAVCSSVSETIEKLFSNFSVVQNETSEIKLLEVQELFNDFQSAKSTKRKKQLLSSVWIKMNPEEVFYFTQLILRKQLLKNAANIILSALSGAFNKKEDELRQAYKICGSLAKVAVLAKKDELHTATIQLFQPFAFMEATSIKRNDLKYCEGLVIEKTLPGLRCHIHIENDRVEIYNRENKNVSDNFPEIRNTLATEKVGHVILEGNICTIQHEKFNNNLLANNLEKQKNQYPAVFIASDILFHRERSLTNMPFYKRRNYLREISAALKISVSQQILVKDSDHLQQLIDLSSENGNNLIFKKRNSAYSIGISDNWLKIKKPGHRINAVVMYAHAESAINRNIYSALTLGISVKGNNRFKEDFIPIGKAKVGFSGKVKQELTNKIKELTVERYGPTSGLIPAIGVELEFEVVLKNKRSKAGMKLQLPKIKRFIYNIKEEHVDTLERVEEIQSKLSTTEVIKIKEFEISTYSNQ